MFLVRKLSPKNRIRGGSDKLLYKESNNFLERMTTTGRGAVLFILPDRPGGLNILDFGVSHKQSCYTAFGKEDYNSKTGLVRYRHRDFKQTYAYSEVRMWESSNDFFFPCSFTNVFFNICDFFQRDQNAQNILSQNHKQTDITTVLSYIFVRNVKTTQTYFSEFFGM